MMKRKKIQYNKISFKPVKPIPPSHLYTNKTADRSTVKSQKLIRDLKKLKNSKILKKSHQVLVKDKLNHFLRGQEFRSIVLTKEAVANFRQKSLERRKQLAELMKRKSNEPTFQSSKSKSKNKYAKSLIVQDPKFSKIDRAKFLINKLNQKLENSQNETKSEKYLNCRNFSLDSKKIKTPVIKRKKKKLPVGMRVNKKLRSGQDLFSKINSQKKIQKKILALEHKKNRKILSPKNIKFGKLSNRYKRMKTLEVRGSNESLKLSKKKFQSRGNFIRFLNAINDAKTIDLPSQNMNHVSKKKKIPKGKKSNFFESFMKRKKNKVPRVRTDTTKSITAFEDDIEEEIFGKIKISLGRKFYSQKYKDVKKKKMRFKKKGKVEVGSLSELKKSFVYLNNEENNGTYFSKLNGLIKGKADLRSFSGERGW